MTDLHTIHDSSPAVFELLPLLADFPNETLKVPVATWDPEYVNTLISRVAEAQMESEEDFAKLCKESLVKLAHTLSAVHCSGLELNLWLSGSWDELELEEFHCRVSPNFATPTPYFQDQPSSTSEDLEAQEDVFDVEEEEAEQGWDVNSMFKKLPIWQVSSNAFKIFEQVQEQIPHASDDQKIKIAAYAALWSELMSITGARHFAPFLCNVFPSSGAAPLLYHFDADRVEHRLDHGLFASVPRSTYKM